MSGRRRAAGVLAVVLAAVLLGACGVAENDEPHVIAPDQVPPELLDPDPSTTTSSPTPTVQPITVYYLAQREGTVRLVAVTREVSNQARPRDRLLAVLTPPTAVEAQAGIRTSIPADTEVLDTALADGVLTIDLSRSLFDIQGQELRNAFAQLVWTATELPDVQRVRFRVDGEEFRAPDEAGIEQPGAVDRTDYLTLAPA